MPENKQITEAEFVNNEERRLSELAGLIHLSGRSNGEIARACHLDRRTVSAARHGQSIRADATERIAYYVRNLNRLQTT